MKVPQRFRGQRGSVSALAPGVVGVLFRHEELLLAYSGRAVARLAYRILCVCAEPAIASRRVLSPTVIGKVFVSLRF